ncbi:aminomethyl-transferring glycine dehydrogenase subunit GcvPA [Desertifilum sp. FACHB-1129]|uniref:Probable glycine dehydrogenase (decarboxylating) subunit 1 n=1 Tax=Desertifilum tharense IPPAS B-1220 TaxID=1781255 RepID=A0A1E5QP01_9CYAN|nr:aminomethyl-transferring glycine dehydrogenase subunit GcvPA [Desertifilum tharense]MBD2311692.1 aminomethyl-transferring glycine dehydrogenase subunit GcvPA [Desertifilum sp. FACHB-1129]MBD2322783.1 aminomethyl-transferring glycine dehydrogenase subunit GcvPA [Desertifilum sp. FACHB-866]MBD2332823.1 aminomethyl-transferring glycine dehydrogenase subunit GcvPA [Desertifilum sp. FACHB-868]MDA0212431.1 aminomethyl-transferring glycine dehydrogenase subunit GcvPA [Cyanobacteria bacterium FC1]O
MARYSPHTAESRQQLLQEIGVESIGDLLKVIPQGLQEVEFDLPEGKSELEVRQLLQTLADRNRHLDSASAFLGAGCYRHFIPAAVWALVSRGEFLTSYTPYQPEAAQGTLQTIFEFQTGIARLTGLPVANASLYDGASATAEAVLMALRLQKKRSHLLIAGSLHPEYQELLDTYLKGLEVTTAPLPLETSGKLDLEVLKAQLTSECAAVVVQCPNFYGIIEDLGAIAPIVHEAGALLIVVVTDPTAYALLKTPGDGGADIVAGEAHCLGTPPSFGGPHLGILATKSEFIRQVPGRLVSITQDARGQQVYTLTLQTREQHIRREKATSNVCTNQSLMAAAASVYMALLGPDGLRQIATSSVQLAHQAQSEIAKLPGYKLLYNAPFFHEFVIQCPISAQEVVNRGVAQGIYPGVPLSRWEKDRDRDLLICVTEMNTTSQIQQLVEFLASIA